MELVTVAEIARRLGVSQATVHSWVGKHSLPCIRLSPRAIRFRLEDVDVWLQNRSTSKSTTHTELVHRVQKVSAELGHDLLGGRLPGAVTIDELRKIVARAER